MPAATSLDKSLTQRSASTISRNNDSAGEASSREIARTAVDIESLSATLEAIDSLPRCQGRDFPNHRGEKQVEPAHPYLYQTSFNYVASLNKEESEPRR
jgi:hypothetical protein